MHFYCPTPKGSEDQQAGFSLVSIMVMITVALIGIVFAMRVLSEAKFTASLLESKMTYAEIERALINIVETELHEEIQARTNCIDPATFLDSEPEIEISDSFTFTAVNPQLTAAMDRCENPDYPANPGAPGQNSLYFCLKITEETSNLTEFANALLEVRVELVDLYTMNPISCSAYDAMRASPSGGSGGILLGLDLYWQADLNNQRLVNIKGINTIIFRN